MNRRASALVCFAVAAVLGYALHRAYFSIGAPSPRAVGPSVHIPYFWRVATCAWWGAIAAAAGWRWPQVEPLATKALPWAVAVAVGIAVLIP